MRRHSDMPTFKWVTYSNSIDGERKLGLKGLANAGIPVGGGAEDPDDVLLLLLLFIMFLLLLHSPLYPCLQPYCVPRSGEWYLKSLIIGGNEIISGRVLG